MTQEDLDYQFVVYVDEAGDAGLQKVRPIDPNGSSEWLVMSAIVIDRRRQLEVVSWVREIRNALRITQGPALHFRKLSNDRRIAVCQHFAQQPLRGFVMMSNKKNMRQHRNVAAERMSSKQWFYNWCVRLLLERVTDWCEEYSIQKYGEPRLAKIIFSESGKHSYEQTKAYYYLLKRQARAGSTYLNKREIKHSVLDYRLVEKRRSDQIAGLQIADTFASAFNQSVDCFGTTPWNPDFAKLLKPRIATKKGLVENFGLTLWPIPYFQANLNPRQKIIFRHYGFSI